MGILDAATARPDMDGAALADVLDRLTKRLADMSGLLRSWTPEYEQSGPFTFGSSDTGGVQANGCVTFDNPFMTACEWTLLGALFNSAAGNATLSADGYVTALPSTSAPDTTDRRRYAAFTPSNNFPDFAGEWFPLDAGAKLYLCVMGTGGKSAYVTVGFRRRINAARLPAYGG